MFPDFNHSGVIPPFVTDPAQAGGAPYDTNMVTIAAKLATTAERRVLLMGLLDYREALRAIGITAGFQLIDGSFTEDCEQLRGRPPGDIDVVTFGHLPVAAPNQIQQFLEQNIALFTRAHVKETYKCDAFMVDIGKNPQLVLEETFYWYGLFSHQKTTYTWKGTLRVPLMADDAAARAMLAEAAGAEQAVNEVVPQGAEDGA